MKYFARFSAISATFLLTLASGAHAVLISGNIAVYEGTTLLGYVSKSFDSQNSYTYKPGLANALSVQIDTSTSVFDIIALNGPDPAHPYVGAVGGSGGYNFSSGQLGYAYLAGTGHTDAGSTPTFAPAVTTSITSLGYNGPAESMIWSLSGDILNAQWVNSDGSLAYQTLTFYDPAVDFLGLVGDFNKFNQTFPGENASLVTLRFTGNLSSTNVPEPGTLEILALSLAGLAFIRRRKCA